jgi:signal transduction histidine kinase
MRLGLWVKLTVAFVFAAFVPVASTAYLARQVVAKRYSREHQKTLREVGAQVGREIAACQAAAEQKVELLARDSDPKIGRAILELARGGLSAELRRELDEEGPQLMLHLGFDVLLIVDPQDRLLAVGHAAGRVGLADPLPGRLAGRHPGRAVFVRLPAEVRRGDQVTVEHPLAVVAARKVSGSGTHVVVAGGLLVDRALWPRLPQRDPVAYRLIGARGNVIRDPPEGWSRWQREPQVRLPLPGARDTAGWIIVAVSNAEQVAARQRLDLIIMALAISAFLFIVLVMGAVIVRRVTGRLGKVASAAVAVAGGDLTVTLPMGPADEVGDLVQAFNRMTVDLREARERLRRAERIAAWQEIARRIAHEIKNPLTPIQLSIETLRRANAAQHPDFQEILEESTTTILEEVERLRRIVTEFSQFARLPKPRLAPGDLNEVVRSVVALWDAGGIPLETELAEDLPPLQFDREQIVQVLHNLLTNARDALAGTGGPRIQVRTWTAGSDLCLSVSDNGHGFGEEVREQIFVPYFTTKKEGGGTGLGLAIVLEHGGSIAADAVPGEGATFTVRLPASTGGGAAPTIPIKVSARVRTGA